MTDEAPKMTPEMEAAIRQRVKAAIEGPWEVGDGYRDGGIGIYAVGMELANVQDTIPDVAEFIGHVRTDVPALLSEIDQLRERLAAAEAERDDLGERLYFSEAGEAMEQYRGKTLRNAVESYCSAWESGMQGGQLVVGDLRKALNEFDGDQAPEPRGAGAEPEPIFTMEITVNVDELPEHQPTIRHCEHRVPVMHNPVCLCRFDPEPPIAPVPDATVPLLEEPPAPITVPDAAASGEG